MQRYTGPPLKTPGCDFRRAAAFSPSLAARLSLRDVSAAVAVIAMLLYCVHSLAAEAANSTARWKIDSVKICKARTGAILPSIEVIGHFPVYSFFIPRPVWTVNGNVVEAKPLYSQGRLVAFELLNAGLYLEHGKKNTVKFALPDHNGSRIFLFDHSRVPPGECYEFF